MKVFMPSRSRSHQQRPFMTGSRTARPRPPPRGPVPPAPRTRYRKSATSRSSAAFDRAPTSSLTTWPPSNTLTVGMSMTPCFTVVCGFSSAFTLTTSIASPCSAAIASRTGPSWRHGPHHSAQYSTITGLVLRTTESLKLSSVRYCLDRTHDGAPFGETRRSAWAGDGAAGELVVPVAGVPFAEMQGQAVGAAAVRADLDQAAQPALQPGQLRELVGDRGQLGLG